MGKVGIEFDLPGGEFVNGDPFPTGPLITAKLIGDPIALTIRVLDKVGYFTRAGTARWTYIDMPKFVWDMLTNEQKRIVIHFHYVHEGGTTMLALFQ